MATLIQAVTSYGPRVEITHTVQTREIAEFISGRTSINCGEIENVLRELNNTILFFAKQGSAVKLAGVGIFRPGIKLDGTMRIGFRLDNGIGNQLNVDGIFVGKVRNAEHTGKSSDELKELWNEEHPDDLIA